VTRVGGSGIFNDGLTGPHGTEVTCFKREQLSITVLLCGGGGVEQNGCLGSDDDAWWYGNCLLFLIQLLLLQTQTVV
jgi:hypothetical protein